MAWTPEAVKHEAVHLMRAGYTPSQVAARTGMNVHTLHSWRTRQGIPRPITGPGRDTEPEKWQALNRLCFATVPVPSLREAARLAGVSKNIARGMWHALRSYRRAGLVHPKLGGVA